MSPAGNSPITPSSRRGPHRRSRTPLASVLASLGILTLSSTACCGPPQLFAYEALPGPDPTRPPPMAAPPEVAEETVVDPTAAIFTNVDFRFDEDLVLRIDRLVGEMRGHDSGPVVFDDPGSFDMVIGRAQATMDATSLTALMRRYVFAYEGAPIRDLQVMPDGDALRLSGILHKVIDIPFEMRAAVSVTVDGWIRLHPTEMRICDLSGLGFLDALGIELDELIDLGGAPAGIRVEDNDLFLLPLEVMPAPRVRGHVEGVRVEGQRLVLDLGPARDGTPAPATPPSTATMPVPDASNYMYFRGGILHFGKLFMSEADMQVVDESPEDPFDFFLELYQQQLVAGFTRNRPDFGLEVHMVDYAKLQGRGR